MKRKILTSAIKSAIGLSAAIFVLPVAAQDQDDTDVELEEVIVTGSLIRNPNLTRSAPVNVISSEEMEYQSISVVEEMLREVPGAVPSIGANVNNGNGGFSYVNLRGLGSNRNVVLVDGRRMAPSEINGRFDLNNVPVALVERVEVLTGGASTTYGADAIAGVVNFITKTDFTGAEINTSIGETAEGDGGKKTIDITLGADLDGGRGNAVFNIGYQKSDPVYQGDREFSEFVHFYTNGNRGGSGLGSFNTRIGNVNPTGADNANLSLGGVQDDRTFAAAFTPYNYGPSNAFQTPFERFNIYSAVNYEINDSVEAYGKAIYSQNTVNTLIAPSGSFGDSVTVALNHPNLSDAQRNALCAFDTDPAEGSYVPTFTQGQCDAAGAATGPTDPNYLTVDTELRRRNVEGGPRISEFTSHYFNYSMGLRGDLSDSISWDVFGSYGNSDQTQVQKGYWMKSRFRQSLLSGPDGCNDSNNGCIPVDFFGPTGSITDEMNNFLQGGESRIAMKFDMTQVSANITGEAGFSSPWAADKVNFALGAEFRDYKGSRESDVLSQSGDLGGAGGAAPNISGGYSVKELLLEAVIPVVQGAFLAEEVTAEAGVRYSDYTIRAGGAEGFSDTTWKLGLSWTPIQDVTARATFARAVRAPNVKELFEPVVTELDNLGNDPCASTNDEGVNSGFVPTGALRDVCIAQGAPVNSIGFIPQPAAGQVNTTGGGNLNLEPEESDSLTVGFVIQPSAVENLSVTIDYYNITIDGAITTPTTGDAIAECFDNPDPTSTACTSIVRSPINGGLSGDEAVVKGLPLTLSNAGELETSGVDLAINYQQAFGDVLWSSSFIANKTIKSTFRATPSSINRECVGLYSADCASIQPEKTFNWRNTVSYADLDVSLMWRYISSNDYEYADSDTAFIGEPEGGVLGFQNFNRTESYNLFDLTLRYTVSENLTITGVVSNLLDKEPPLTGAFIGATGFSSGNTYPSTFDTIGRRYNLAAKLTF